MAEGRAGLLPLRAVACGLALATVIAPVFPHRAQAQPPSARPAGALPPATLSQSPRWHLFFGLDAAERSFFGHAGLVWAPFETLHQSGFRLRYEGNIGLFDYRAGSREITGLLATDALMAGFEWMTDTAAVAVYGGPALQYQDTDPYDPGKPRQGTRFGGKVLVEGWVQPAAGWFLNASATYTSAAQTYVARFALTAPISEQFAIEPEFVAFGEPGYDQQRYGLLGVYAPTPDLMFKFGGGIAVDPDDEGAYAALQVKVWK